MRATVIRRGGGTGRRAGFKIRFLHGSVGSIPTLGTTSSIRSRALVNFSSKYLRRSLQRYSPDWYGNQMAFLAFDICDLLLSIYTNLTEVVSQEHLFITSWHQFTHRLRKTRGNPLTLSGIPMRKKQPSCRVWVQCKALGE